jgi:cytochrome c556
MNRYFISFGIGCLCLASFFVSCSQQSDEQKSEVPEKKVVKKVWKPEEVKSSELALLMRAMWDSSMVRKGQIESGENVFAYGDLFKEIHSANATDPTVLTETFYAFAEVYQQNMEAVDAAQSSEEKKTAFNNLVNTCVTCHQQYCQGPIPKIKKLYIKE